LFAYKTVEVGDYYTEVMIFLKKNSLLAVWAKLQQKCGGMKMIQKIIAKFAARNGNEGRGRASAKPKRTVNEEWN